MAWLEPPRIYQSMIVDTTGRFAALAEVAPPTSLAGRPTESVRVEALERGELVFSRWTDPLSTDQVFAALTALLRASESAPAGPGLQLDSVQAYLTPDLRPLARTPSDDNRSLEFASYLLAAPVVPFERSPLGPESLGALSTEGFAMLAQVGRDPLLWIEAAGAMVLVRALLKWGQAFADVGDDAIRYHLPRLLHLPPSARTDRAKH